MTITRDEAVTVLKPYLDKLRECVVLAWDDYITQYNDLRFPHTSRTRANIIHDLMCLHAKRQFAPIKGVHIRETNGLFLVDFHGELQIRFKKLNRSMKSSNIPTQQTLHFFEQLELEGIPSATRLVIGYILDEAQTQIRTVVITCPKGQEIEWYLELEEPAETRIAGVPAESEVVKTSKRVRVKEIKKFRENYE